MFDLYYMTEVMPKVGKAFREAYHWIDKDHPIFCTLLMLVGTGHRPS